MNVTALAVPDVLLVEPVVHGDHRGFLMECYSAERYRNAGIALPFVQDNLSYSRRGVLRGLHFQEPTSQGKLVQVLRGEVFDVAVDVRTGSPTFGAWVGEIISAENRRQLWIPPGFAHGFVVTGEEALFSYKCTAPYDRTAERYVRWDDPAIGIRWPAGDVTLSDKDRAAPLLRDVPAEHLPRYRA